MLAQLSDLHVTAGPDGDATARAVAAAVATVLRIRPLPDAVLVSGDLAEDGTTDEYARVADLLAPLPMPVHVLAGNHDDRPALEAALGRPAAFAVTCGDLRLVGCDTAVPGHPDGSLDVEWLAARLDEDRSTPTVVAMHHPPVAIGLVALDAIGLPGPERTGLAALLERHPQVRRIVAGHVHRGAVAVLGGRPVVTAPSTTIAARLDLVVDDFDMAPEPPGLLVHALVGGELVTHVQPVLPAA